MVWVNVCHFLYKWKHLDAEVCPEVRTVEALTHKVAGRQLVEEMSWADWWRQRSATCTEGPHTHKVTFCWQPTHWWLLWRCQVPCPSLWFHWSLFDSVVSLLNCTQLTLCWALVLCGCVCQHQCSPKKMLHNLRNRRLLRIWRMLTFFRWVSNSQTWWCVLIFYLSRFSFTPLSLSSLSDTLSAVVKRGELSCRSEEMPMTIPVCFYRKTQLHQCQFVWTRGVTINRPIRRINLYSNNPSRSISLREIVNWIDRFLYKTEIRFINEWKWN